MRYYDPIGKRRARTFATKTQAKAFKASVETDKRRGDRFDPAPGKVTFEAWAERYMAQKLSLRPRTVEKYNSGLHNHLIPAFGHVPIGALTRDQVQEWIADMDRARLSPETIRNHYALMAAIMKRAHAVGAIPRTPCYAIDLPRAVRREPRFLSAAQVDALADAHPERYRAMVYTAAYLGLRWQEVTGLRRDRLDMRPGQLASLRVVTTIERANGRSRPVEYGKSDAARRTLKMPNHLRDRIARHLAEWGTDEWVFSAPEGGILTYDNFMHRVWAPAVQAAGVAPLTFHELRHTAAAFMIDDGGDPLQIKRRMGHEDVRTTFNLYGHRFPDREEDLVAALDRRFDAAEQAKKAGSNGYQMGTTLAFPGRPNQGNSS